MKDKSSLRIHFLKLLEKQGSAERLNKSRQIAEKLFLHTAFQKAQTILFYASLPSEVETFAMMAEAIKIKKRVALPIVVRDQRKMIPTLTNTLEGFEQGSYGISEPRLDASNALSLSEIDAVIVPGLAFDNAHHRLGRGAGYYDRFLSEISKDTTTIGLAFDFQLVDCLPTEEHDMPLHHIIAG